MTTKLKVDLRVGESLDIDDGRIKIVLMDKTGQLARLDIRADKDVKVVTHRHGADFAKKGLTV